MKWTSLRGECNSVRSARRTRCLNIKERACKCSTSCGAPSRSRSLRIYSDSRRSMDGRTEWRLHALGNNTVIWMCSRRFRPLRHGSPRGSRFSLRGGTVPRRQTDPVRDPMDEKNRFGSVHALGEMIPAPVGAEKSTRSVVAHEWYGGIYNVRRYRRLW